MSRTRTLSSSENSPGDVVTLLDLVELRATWSMNARLEARMLDEHFHERRHRRADGARVDDRHIAADHARVLEASSVAPLTAAA